MIRRRLLAATLLAAAAVAVPAAASTQTATSPTKGVVVVKTNLAYQDAAAAGTGMVLTSNGEVLTNNHVIRGATTIRVTVKSPRRTYTARVLGYDLVDDVALLKLQGASGLATVTRGNSAALKVGQPARAVGNANGSGKLVVTAGRITGIRRTITIRDEQGSVTRLAGLIQISARLVPGDSGGPLLDASGRVVGINTAGSSSFYFQAPASGYAIPINRALSVVRRIEAGRSSATVHVGATAFLGLQLTDTSSGVAVAAVVPGSPADKAGLAAGGVVTALNGKPVRTFDDLRLLLFTKHPGDRVTIAWTDELGNETSARIVLAAGPPQ